MNFFRVVLTYSILIVACSSSKKNQQQSPPPLEKSLLWQISGNGLPKPSYLFGTIHMLCKDDAVLSDSLKSAIEHADRVYLELDMDNLFEMVGALRHMKMRNDTTLADLLNPEDYQKVKTFIENKNGMLPFSELETYKPLLASSMFLESSLPCNSPVAMEQLIMAEAKKYKKRIDGLETMNYQMSIFDSIPYKYQAEQLLKSIQTGSSNSQEGKEFDEMMQAYKDQDLEKLSQLINKEDNGIFQYEDILLYNRNRNWVQKLNTIMKERPVFIAVGAGHLPGEKGVINLLRKAGYKVKAIKSGFSNKSKTI